MRSPALGYLLVASCAWFARPAVADVIIFHDLVDQITVEHIGSEHLMVIDGAIVGSAAGSCAPGEAFACFVRLSSPTAGVTPNGPSMVVGITEQGVDPTVAWSDSISYQPGTSMALLRFASDPAPTDPNAEQNVVGLTPGVADALIAEDGTVQTAFTVTWSDQTTDTIQFQSDVEPQRVPEPASAILVATGLIGLSLIRRRGQVRRIVTA
jgi:hypothetical protein